MKVTLLQMNSVDDMDANLAQAERLIDEAAARERPDLLLLPEVWTYQGGTLAGARAAAEPAGGRAYRMLADKARRYGMHLVGGSYNERDGEHVFNTMFVFDREGRQVARYRKIHLFDMLGADGTVYKESALYTPGDEVVTFDADGVRFGCAICYDLRFAELFLALSKAGAQAILLPAAFTLNTGLAHWEALIRARAIETQTYLLAANQVGAYPEDGAVRQNYGHSMVVGPWGHVVARAEDTLGAASAHLDLDFLRSVRDRMPVQHHRVLKA